MKTNFFKTSILMMFVASSINAKTLITIHDIKGQPHHITQAYQL